MTRGEKIWASILVGGMIYSFGNWHGGYESKPRAIIDEGISYKGREIKTVKTKNIGNIYFVERNGVYLPIEDVFKEFDFGVIKRERLIDKLKREDNLEKDE
jgi:hypothetical protein